MRWPSSSGDAYWSRMRLKPRLAARRIEASLPAATQNGGCGFCAGGGSTTMSSNCQNRPRWENRSRDSQDLAISSIDSSKRSSASSGAMQKPLNSLWR